MAKTILWTVFLSASDRSKAERLVARIHNALGRELCHLSLETYPHERSVYKGEFSIRLNVDDREVTDAVLRDAAKLAHKWEVGGLHLLDDWWGHTTDGTMISGVDSVNFGVAADESERTNPR